MLENILFYIIFLCQIVLVSYYYPKQILIRLKYLFENFSPEEYPNLYTKNLEEFKKKESIFRTATKIILVIGLFILLGLGFLGYYYSMGVPAFIPFFYFMLQVAPIIKLDISRFAYFNLVRKSDSSVIRKAELQPRRLFNFISPIAVSIAVFLYFTCIIYFLSLYKFEFYFWNQPMIIFIAITISNLLFIAIVYKNLYGKKIDPYSAAKDRIKNIEVNIKSLVFISIGASIFLMIMGTINKLDLRLWAPSIMSIYLQFIVFAGVGYLLRELRIDNIDFEVYKKQI